MSSLKEQRLQGAARHLLHVLLIAVLISWHLRDEHELTFNTWFQGLPSPSNVAKRCAESNLARRAVKVNNARVMKKKRKKSPGLRPGGMDLSHLPFGEPHAFLTSQIERAPLMPTERSPNFPELLAHAKNLSNHPDDEVRRAAVNGLHMSKIDPRNDREIMDALLEAVYDRDLEVRWKAIDTFRKIAQGDYRSSKLDEDRQYYWSVDGWVAQIVEKVSVHSRSESLVKIFALQALERLAIGGDGIAKNCRDYAVYASTCQWQLIDDDPLVRIAAINAISALDYRACRSKIVARKNHDEHPEVRKAAQKAIARSDVFEIKRSVPFKNSRKLGSAEVKREKRQQSMRYGRSKHR